MEDLITLKAQKLNLYDLGLHSSLFCKSVRQTICSISESFQQYGTMYWCYIDFMILRL